MRGVPMGVIVEQIGHADTRMTEKHCAHLAASYVADAIRAFPDTRDCGRGHCETFAPQGVQPKTLAVSL
jgi:hypothetical protein